MFGVWEDSSTPRQVVLGAISKQAEQAMKSKPVGCILSWPLLQFLSLGSSLAHALTSLDERLELQTEINPLVPPLLLVIVVITAVKPLTKVAPRKH